MEDMLIFGIVFFFVAFVIIESLVEDMFWLTMLGRLCLVFTIILMVDGLFLKYERIEGVIVDKLNGCANIAYSNRQKKFIFQDSYHKEYHAVIVNDGGRERLVKMNTNAAIIAYNIKEIGDSIVMDRGSDRLFGMNLALYVME